MSGEPDPLVRCPFKKEHVFTKSHLQSHIIKCSRKHPGHFTCPYNATHRFLNKEDHMKHVLICPDISCMLPWSYLKHKNHGNLKETIFHIENARSFNLEHENWDAEYQ